MFKLTHNGKVIFHAPPASDVLERIAAVYGLGISKEMLRINWGGPGLSISGYISKPHVNRSRNSTHIIVNDRDIVSRVLNKALMDGYGPMMPKGRYPIVVIQVAISVERVDVNVHPAKTEVRFDEAVKIERAVMEAVQQALSGGELIPPVDLGDLEKGEATGVRIAMSGRSEFSRLIGQTQATINIDTGEVELPRSRKVEKAVAVDIGEEGAGQYLPSSITIKGQAGNCYIIGETKEGIVIIDQHAAHEKIVYEDLRKQLGDGQVGSQELLTPVTIELSADEADALEGLMKDLRTLGFQVEPFGGRSCIVKQVPSVLGVTVEPGALHDLITELSKGGPLTTDKIRDSILATMACHTSTRGGQSLELFEMKNLIQLLYQADEPFNCPHGRPTIIFLPFGLLEKKFARRT
jgi:DNA mismatch repair protein MutL